MKIKETALSMKDNKKEEWEKAMLEENSYYDIDIINKANNNNN